MRLSQGEKTGTICRSLEISKQSYYQWHKEYGGLQVSQAKRLKELEKALSRLLAGVGVGEVGDGWPSPLVRAAPTATLDLAMRPTLH